MSSSLAKIDSPYAKFGVGGQLTCSLCNSTVKSAKVWIAHVNGRQHRDNLVSKNTKKPQQQQQSKPTTSRPEPSALKRPAPSGGSNGNAANDPASKKLKATTIDRAQPTARSSDSKPPPAKSALANLPETESDDESDSGSDAEEEELSKPQVASTDVLPRDFFDTSAKPAVEEKLDQNKAGPSNASKDATAVKPHSGELPEGFFDNREMDAKVRGVELKDPLDEEWSKFQKEIQKVEVVSEQIVEEDEDQGTLERDLDEAEEQMREWSRINELEKRKDAMAGQDSENSDVRQTLNEAMEKESTDDEDDISIENVLDWRSKDVWK